jgi:hypothetical protein
LANADVNIYGYPMAFRRFAFAQVSNMLKEETWIDGEVTVPEPGDFRISFSSLALDCTGGLNNGLVDPANCEIDPTVNCEETLGDWKTKTDFVTVGFIPNSLDICGDKNLQVGHILDIRALERRLGLTTEWKPDGTPENAFVSGSTDNFLDRDEENTSSHGFAIQLDSGSKLTVNGWYKFTGAFGLPFWGMKPVDFGLANAENTRNREKTAVLGKNEMNEVWSLATLEERTSEKVFDVSYQWGSTGLEFTLPVVYQSEPSDKESIFLGKTKETDLGVMSAKAGIDYIKPETTKVSFGASADFEAIADLNIQIDLNDPSSIATIDRMLGKFGIGGDPLASTIGMVLAPLHEVESYADKGLMLGMESLGVKALQEAVVLQLVKMQWVQEILQQQ